MKVSDEKFIVDLIFVEVYVNGIQNKAIVISDIDRFNKNFHNSVDTCSLRNNINIVNALLPNEMNAVNE
ncbi:hypothetical protein DERP_006523 [Dermatophagoides pteronyssinus]|uniref:Uncharacterized protein n=1 Tax=Dermatophagoides pteronyssinus TaxID=6956 RepID=A0ABQ8IQG8_DERPT|nr:hypothetical protein DERP_006523 [Dermatophagoides pteronyssinus]